MPTLCNATMSKPLDQRTELLYAAADIDRASTRSSRASLLGPTQPSRPVAAMITNWPLGSCVGFPSTSPYLKLDSGRDDG